MKKITFILLALSALFLITCKKAPELKVYDVNFVSENVDVSSNSATITIHYSYLTKLDYVNAYVSKSNYFGDSSVVPAEVNDSIIIISFNDLQPGTKYYYKYEYSNGLNTATSAVKTFNIEGSTDDPIILTSVDEITMSTVKASGNVTSWGIYSPLNFTYGVCWSTSPTPTIADSYIKIEDTNETFDKILIVGLEPGTKYYVRAFVSSTLIFYGNTTSFTTYSEWGGGMPSEGILPGVFSVSETQRVRFAKGNLQYQASTNTFRFADRQMDFTSDDNASASATYEGWIDAFAKGTSGWYNGRPRYMPYEHEGAAGEYTNYTLTDDYMYADWGVYNPISNGGNVKNQWRGLLSAEYQYLNYTRTTPSGMNFVMASVDNMYGRIIFPDDWNASLYTFNNINQHGSYYQNNPISLSDWNNILEPNGAVFLPVKEAGTSGDGASVYWSKDQMEVGYRYTAIMASPNWRCCIRLVHDID